jgi:succinate dehydrogenase / fumarate reductase flavoprotein subunit
MGGLWVDYNLESTIPGLFVLGEANFSDHGANRLGASALMQGLADGYFVIPATIGHYLATNTKALLENRPDETHAEARGAREAVEERLRKLLGAKSPKRTPTSFHRELGRLVWDKCGMARDEKGLKEALARIPALREEFWETVTVPGTGEEFNQTLEHAGRVADFLEFAELLCRDALHREESCGGHFRVEHQVTEGPEKGEAKRDDERFQYVAAWEWRGLGEAPALHREPLEFEYVKPTQRSYK